LQKSVAKWVAKTAFGGRFIDRRKHGGTLSQKSINSLGCVVAVSDKCSGMVNASTLSEVTRANLLGREHKAGTASLSIESFELSRLRDGSTLVVWILNEVLVLKIQYREAS
jgi:hypothetical protein